jgi:hypothetical protein
MKYLLSLLASLLICTYLPAQNGDKIHLDYQLLDTIRQENLTTWMTALWLKDTIEIGVQNGSDELNKKVLEYLNKKKALTIEEESAVLADQRALAQNCYSYAFEKYFEYDKDFSQSTFAWNIKTENKSTEQLLKHSFEKIAEFPAKPIEMLRMSLPNHVIVAFQNDANWISHLAYYADGILYSKNGTIKPLFYENLYELLKDWYWHTEVIKLYRFKKSVTR